MAEQEMEKFSEEIKKHFDEKTEEVEKRFDEKTSRLEKHFDEKAAETQRHFDVVAEDLSSKLDSVAELASGIPAIQEMVAKNSEDIGVMKMDVEAIKQGLRRKVDVDEFATLEKRVTALETKSQK